MLRETSGNTPSVAKKNVLQEDCFTPKRVLKRSPQLPSRKRLGKENYDINSKDVHLTEAKKQQSTLSGRPHIQGRECRGFKEDSSYVSTTPRQVQDSCFTPQKHLKRTPPQLQYSHREPLHQPTALIHMVAPPTSHWELPRTPTTTQQEGVVSPPTYNRELPRTTQQEGVVATPTYNRKLPRIPTTTQQEGVVTPPTSHWELPRTPTTTQQEGVVTPPTSNRKLPRTTQQEGVVAPHTCNRKLPRTPTTTQQEGVVTPPTSHWELPRTPTTTQQEGVVATPTSNRELPRTPTTTQQEGVVATPTSNRELPRTPTTTQQEGVVTPPTSHWELPHTPAVVVEQVQLTSNKTASTPTRLKLHPHPLSHSSRAPPAQPVMSLLHDPESQGRGKETRDLPPNGIGCLPGMKCTEDDLAFLQRMNNIKQYKSLKIKAEQLEKEEKTANEEKEQLEHAVLKVQKDLDDMKCKYQDTISTINALISNPGNELATEGGHLLESDSTQCLSRASVAQLKKMNLLTSAQVEKADRQLKVKLAELDQVKCQLEQKIRELEVRVEHEKRELDSGIQASAAEMVSLKRKICMATHQSSSTKAEVDSLQSELAKLELSETPTESTAERCSRDKRRAEQRLRMIIKQCDMYVQRHQMLKEMGIRTKH